MVVGGVPVPIGSHAQRVANFALGMQLSAKEVMNPVTGEPIQVENSWSFLLPTHHLTPKKSYSVYYSA